MATRRGFVSGLLAAGLMPRPTWADAGSPAYLAAALRDDDSYWLIGLSAAGQERFRLPLPERGHAAAAHPLRPDAVAFARRPGTFALIIDCRDGTVRAELRSPPGRHFYGHGAYAADGTLLLTTENDYDAVRGVIGVWDVAAGYLRVGEFASGGIGPHEIARLPDGGFAIANGGIETHPDSDREILNRDTMAPRLTYAEATGHLPESVALPQELHQHSIRHLSVRGDGLVAFAMQWQGDASVTPPLLGLHRRGEAVRLVKAPPAEHARMQNYAGSVSFSGDGELVAITSPKGGLAQVFEVETGDWIGSYDSADLCGVAAAAEGFCVTTGTGAATGLAGATPLWTAREKRLAFDNHLVRIGPIPA
ncbi:DUF1513 domain-containing protein [Frigidibacter sp. ROC022]|uniref:DUF1513 domain-containing protein n=1 Tax=Frigidibacter sp. ROC022 TaxID=2971796 RepID=UPI00215A66EA|nr:DUF1513 domain-containing protein [Frigidibacter sp. ROC022]MCR8724167.1 DUF1513 domain-containing protein [Frigidibacter sp. ROC022]